MSLSSFGCCCWDKIVTRATWKGEGLFHLILSGNSLSWMELWVGTRAEQSRAEQRQELCRRAPYFLHLHGLFSLCSLPPLSPSLPPPLISLISNYFMYMSIWHVCISVHHEHAVLAMTTIHRSSGTGVIICDPPCWDWKSNPGPLIEQTIL